MASNSADYGWYLAQYHDASVVVPVATTDSGTLQDKIAVKSTRHSIFVQRVILSVTTDAAQSLTFQDDANTPVVFAKSPASPGLGVEVVADFGPKGFQLTEGKNLDIVISGAGLGAQVSIEAYQKVTAVSTTL
jgi:hypothetical protein